MSKAIVSQLRAGLVVVLMIASLAGGAMACQQQPPPENIPVVCSVLREQKLALSLGADGYLAKPIERGELRRTIEQFASPDSKVLVVDDDPDVIEIISRILDGTSYQVITARDGWAGLATARE